MTSLRGSPEATSRFGPLVDVAHLGTTVRAFAQRPRSLDAVLAAAADRWPEREALVAPAGTRTYAQLDATVTAAAGGLRRLGVRPGARVAAALGHDLPLAALPWVASRLRASALLLHTGLAPERWRAPLDGADVEVVLVDDATRDVVAAVAGDRRVVDVDDVFGAGDNAPSPAHPPSPPHDDEDLPVALLATSGTTGVPKTTRVTSRGLVHAALAYVDLLDLGCDPGAQERSLVVLPLHSIGPLSAQTTAMALVGGACVLAGDTRPAPALAAMAEHGITHLDAVPAWLGLLARVSEHPVLPAWRTLIYGGAPMPAATAAAIAARHPGVALYDVWGLSETHGPATALRLDPGVPAPAGAVGTPVAGVEVRTPEPGSPGELRVRGANVTPGYLGDEPQVVRDGWLHTGDLGTVADDGSVRILDRAKDVILRGGTNVFSVEVEQVLTAAPGVAEAAVYGVPDEVGGEAVAAAVVLDGGAQLDVPALRRLVGGRVGVHAVPRRIVAVPELPRNTTGKIDKLRLREDHR